TLTKLTNGTFDPQTVYTSWSLPYLPQNGIKAFTKDGTELEIITDPVSNQCKIGGNYSKETIAVGYGYDFAYTFSPFLVKREAQSGHVSAELEAMLLVKDLIITTQGTTTFDVSIESDGTLPTQSSITPTTTKPQAQRILILDRAEGLTVKLICSAPQTCLFQNSTWRYTHGQIN
ncbi:MAG: hypothetical protein J0G29_02050, partial [Alphaproteobacteria bacterium]|nr:hypothetical protein [Alphaproteobacteria bacterium]